MHDHLAYAEWLASLGRHEEAIAAAEGAARRFTGRDEKPVLREFLIAAYSRAGRSSAAVREAWEHYQEDARLDSFVLLKETVRSHDASVWPEWRDRAIALKRAQTESAREGAAGFLPRPGRERVS